MITLMGTTIGQQLRACGRNTLPDHIKVGRDSYRLEKVFKHDFFAATALYQRLATPNAPHTPDSHPRLVLKIARNADLLGLPCDWLGEFMAAHEANILNQLQNITQVPSLLTKYGRTGILYPFIPGIALDQKPKVPDNFFDNLHTLLQKIHRQRIVYLDMNKRGNILLTDQQLPALIDFQIAMRIPSRLAGSRRLADWLFNSLAREDLYHFKKHKRRFRPDLMAPDEIDQSRRYTFWIALHRALTRPLTNLRRRLLARLYAKGHLLNDDVASTPHSETDPNRW